MDNNSKGQKYKRNTTNKPIYVYKPISYYKTKTNDSNSDDEEEEFSYRFNDKKLKSLKEKKTKKVQIQKKFEENNTIFSKSEINLLENKIKKDLNFSKNEIASKENIKRKKLKKSSKKKTYKKEDEQNEEDSNSFYEYINNKEEMVKTKSMNDLKKTIKNENKEKIVDNNIIKSETKISDSNNLKNVPEFYGFEVDEDDYKNEENDNFFLFDDMNRDKKKFKSKKIIKTKNNIENNEKNNNNVGTINNSDIKDDNKIDNINNNDKKEKNKSINDIRNNQIKNDYIINDHNENNPIKEEEKLNNKKKKIIKKKKVIKKSSNKKIKENFAIKIQNIWKAYQIRKRIKLMIIIKKIIIKLSDLFKIKKNQYINDFFILLKNINTKNKNSLKIDDEKLKELIEKEKQYDILIIKYEEALKEIKNLKNDLENKKTFFNQNLNLIDNKNQNISINIFPSKSPNNIIDKNFINKNKSKTIINQIEKINDITLRNSNNKKIKNNFIINKKVNIQLNRNKNENILFLNKIIALSKLFNRKNNYNLYLKKYFDKFKNKSNNLKYIQELQQPKKIMKNKNIIINKIKSFSLFKIQNENLNKNFNNNDINILINRNKNIFNEYKLIITKNITKLQILQNNKNQDINKKMIFNNLIINKQINKFINKKQKDDFIIVKLNNYNIENKSINKRNAFYNLYFNREKNINIQAIQKPLIITKKYELNLKSLEKKNDNYIIHKTINKKFHSNNFNFEKNIINYLYNNFNILSKIRNEFHLDKKSFLEKDLFINKIKNFSINNIKRKEHIIYKSKNNNFIINSCTKKSKKEYIITKVQNNFNIRNKINKKNFIINKVISKFKILESEYSEDTIDEYISISELYQLTINSSKKNEIIQKPKNYVINRVINRSIIDKVYKKLDVNNFKENKLIINKINNHYVLPKINNKKYIIYKSSINNFSLYQNTYNKNKLNNHIITKIQNIFYNKSSYKNNNNNLLINNNFVINKIISKLNYPKIKKEENIITRTINHNIKLIDDSTNNGKEENQILKIKKFENNLIITKVISKFKIENIKKDNKEKNKKFKSKFLFISENNQLFIKRNKNKIEKFSSININDINLNDSIKEKEINDSSEINNGEAKKRRKKIRKFKSKKLFISDNNQLKIKAIKKKKEN